MFLDDLQWCSHSEFMLIANIAEEANRKMREWGGSSVDTPTGDSSAAEGPPRNGMRQSNGPWDRGWKPFLLFIYIHAYHFLPGRYTR
jgi:hypothetical protein